MIHDLLLNSIRNNVLEDFKIILTEFSALSTKEMGIDGEILNNLLICGSYDHVKVASFSEKFDFVNFDDLGESWIKYDGYFVDDVINI